MRHIKEEYYSSGHRQTFVNHLLRFEFIYMQGFLYKIDNNASSPQINMLVVPISGTAPHDYPVRGCVYLVA